MTDTPAENTPAADTADAATKPARRSGGALGGKVLAELQEIAAGLGITGASKLRKGELIDAIKQARGEAAPTAVQAAPAEEQVAKGDAAAPPEATAGAPEQATARAAQGERRSADQKQQGGAKKQQDGAKQQDGGPKKQQGGAKQQDGGPKKQGQQNQNDGPKNDGPKNDGAKNDGPKNDGSQNRGGDDRGDEDGGGRRRNRRGRNRGGRGADGEPTYADDDVLVPAAGILDILDNYAFVRTTGYLPSENDVYVSLSMVRKWGLRKGDAVTGQVRQPREGERKEKFNPMVRVDTVNGTPLEEARGRVEFASLTPVHPDERLRLETDPAQHATRLIDLFAPIGKGQRGLVLAAPKAGRTTVVRAVAEAVTTNNPESHVMVVLVDERPEEVTQMQRAVKGEVIASTFDRPAVDHTTVAELAIERAKRLVELGHDVVVVLDSLTRLGRAYVQAAPSGRGGATSESEAAALHPVKALFGAARNAEDGGSLTILATALVETGSQLDATVLEELDGTSNSEVRLRRDADESLFPAVDVVASRTSHEELLLDAQELPIVAGLRSTLAGLEPHEALALVTERLRATGSNAELLLQVSRTPITVPAKR